MICENCGEALYYDGTEWLHKVEPCPNRPRRLPDLPGMAPGIVAVRDGASRGRKLYTLQCERCFATEEPELLVLMTFHFHARSSGGDNPRLCRPCRVEVYADCTCDSCREDRKA